jgi:hypothetical protein
VDIPAHPTNVTMMAWFTTARSDDLDDTLKRVVHQRLMEFSESHLPVLGDTAIALLPIQNEGNTVWSERVADIGDPELPTHCKDRWPKRGELGFLFVNKTLM